MLILNNVHNFYLDISYVFPLIVMVISDKVCVIPNKINFWGKTSN